MALCSERCKLHGIDLRVTVPTSPIYISCRPAQLCQVLLNLINNAHDAIENSPEKWLEVQALENSAGLELKVIDSGPGVPAELREKIFNPFFTTKAVGKGTGLGLSISHGIVKSLNGSLKIAEDSPHSCFAISLPTLRPEAA